MSSIASTWQKWTSFCYSGRDDTLCHKCCQFSIPPHCCTRWQPWSRAGPCSTVNSPEAEAHKFTCLCDSAACILSLWVNLSTSNNLLQAYLLPEILGSWKWFSWSFTWKQKHWNTVIMLKSQKQHILVLWQLNNHLPKSMLL